MPLLKDLQTGAVEDDPKKQLESLVKQINDQNRLISNEDRTKIIKSESGIEALTIGQMPQGGTGILMKDEDGVNRMIIGQLPDGTIGMVISEEGVDVTTIFS